MIGYRSGFGELSRKVYSETLLTEGNSSIREVSVTEYPSMSILLLHEAQIAPVFRAWPAPFVSSLPSPPNLL